MSANPERKAAMARLVTQGKIKYDKPGQYMDETPEDERASIPQYDIEAVKKAFPDALLLNFDEEIDNETGNSNGLFITIHDGKSDTPAKFRIGDKPPRDTEQLIAQIHKFYEAQFDFKKMEEVRDAFDAFDDEED